MRTTSLRKKLAQWVLLPLGIVLLISTVLLHQLALQLSAAPFDHALRDVALLLQERLRMESGRIVLDSPDNIDEILLLTPQDQLFYAVRDADNRLVAGHGSLPFPPYYPGVDTPVYYDGIFEGQDIRFVAMDVRVESKEVTLLVAETVHARNALIRDVLVTEVMPVALLLLLVLLWTVFGLERALRPLLRLQEDVSRRTADDLAPLPEQHVPLEVRPLVREINGLLQRLSKSRDLQRRFIADAAHQLRTPLASLRAYAGLANRDQRNPEALGRALERLQVASERASRLIQQLLSLARSDSDAEAGMRFQAVLLDELIRQHAPEWLHRAEARGQSLEFEVHPVTVRGDAFSLVELLNNILDNALRYTPDGGRIIVRALNMAGRPMFEVEDSGPGIPASMRAEAFERFKRLPNAQEGGSGLGLAIVQGIARQHHASIELSRSSLGTGLCLRVVFPEPHGPA